jgi:hypothetical protein
MAIELQEHDWNTLVLSIIQGDCILMLGPDAITEKVDGASVPLMQLFDQHLRNKLLPKMPLPEQYSLAQVAQAFKNHIGAIDLRVATDEFFQHRRGLQNQSLEDLAALPFKLVVNTIPGTQMEEAFRSHNKSPECDWYHFKGPTKEMVHEGILEKPLVYHLYGCIDELKSLVLAEDDLLDFLVNVISGTPPCQTIFAALSKVRITASCF